MEPVFDAYMQHWKGVDFKLAAVLRVPHEDCNDRNVSKSATFLVLGERKHFKVRVLIKSVQSLHGGEIE